LLLHDRGVTPALPSTRAPLLCPGDRIGGFRLRARLGSGGAGEVFAAEDDDGRAVALKILRGEHVGDADLAERFVREAQLTRRLGHRNIVAVDEVFWLLDGRPYFTMAWIDGVDAAAWSARRLSLGRFVAGMLQLVDALATAHAAGVAHLDLKPSNILVARDGANDRLMLIDFGAAQRIGSIDPRPVDRSHVFATPQYMSPEQAGGRPVDARSDLYSLGVVMWRLLVGAPPFVGGSLFEVLQLHMHAPPPSPSRAGSRLLAQPIPPELDAIVLRCLAKRPDDRFESAAELRAALEQLARRRPARPPSPWSRRALAAAAATVLATAATTALLLTTPTRLGPDADAGLLRPPPTLALAPPPIAFRPTLIEHSRQTRRRR
jgi:serine/threonine-protein kinase